MAKVLFLMRYPLHRNDNLKLKFDGEMAAARALGHEVYYIGWNKDRLLLCSEEGQELIQTCPLARLPAYGKTVFYIDLMNALKKVILANQMDLVYMRFMPTFGNAPAAMAALKAKGGKLIVEHPTYPFENGKTTSLLRMPVFAYNAKVFGRMESMIDLYTLIGDYCDGKLNGRPAMNIVNGVDVNHYQEHKPCAGTTDIHLLALASMSHWQGYDRLILALAKDQSDERVYVHMVGDDGDGSLKAWEKLSDELGTSNQVIFHGELHGDALDEIVEKCDIGIGGLGLYRKGQLTSMTLKVREYMARGLPFVYAVDDPMVPDDARFCLKLANDDSMIDMQQIIRFAKAAKINADVPAQMRSYAREHMSWEGIMRAVFEKAGV